MVGVPRSKGCKTCRKRKIKCDELRPRCGPCRKGVRECEGYDVPTIFLNTSSNDFPDSSSSLAPGQKVIRFKNHFVEVAAWQHGHVVHTQAPVRDTPKDSTAVVAIAATAAPATAGASAPAPAPLVRKSPTLSWGPVVIRGKSNSSRRVQRYTNRLRQVDIQNAWSAPALRDLDTRIWTVENLLAQFLECVLPEAPERSPLGWVASLVSMKKDVDALPLAMSALAFGWAGHINSQPQLVHKGLQLYNAAIRQLRQEFNTCSPLQMLGTTALFVTFELCEFGSKRNPGWQTHLLGMAAVIKSLGPKRVSVPPYLQMFAFCRVIFCVQGLKHRKRVCAGSALWMSVPFRNCELYPLQDLFGLAAQSCGILERADAVQQGGVAIEALHGVFDTEAMEPERILSDLLVSAQRMKQWHREHNIPGLGGPVHFPCSNQAKWNLDERATARGYPTKLPQREGWTFDDIYTRRMTHFYWSVLLTFYMTIVDNPLLRDALENTSDTRIRNLVIQLTTGDRQRTSPQPGPPTTAAAGPASRPAPLDLLYDECRKLANDISLHSTSSCHNICESFGSLVSYFNLETALAWYERHNGEGAGETERGFEKHCRDMLAGIDAAESNDLCAFDVAVRPEDVLRYPWCEEFDRVEQSNK
ncbi:hypothetical protein F5Y17DRAFT_349423 [Xylariaceae sp. FL0594]|nr:hypothetical protein F5Y17DRAFT_349423 [Xylariaceae sp. FL0594]